MKIWLDDPYADALLALGVAAAYGARAHYRGGYYEIEAGNAEPLSFPSVEKGEVEAVNPPHTFHKFKLSAIDMLGGKRLLPALRAQWDALQPLLGEIKPLLAPGFEDWKRTRFYNVRLRWSGAATFRPMAAKGYARTKASAPGSASATPEFWLLDALRAFGFLTYAQPKLLLRESSLCRWLVFVPATPEPRFSMKLLRQPDLECGARTRAMAHLVASELFIPRVFATQYAELNFLSRTPFYRFTIEPRAFSLDAVFHLKAVVYSLKQYALVDQARMAQQLLDVIEQGDTGALATFVARYMSDRETHALHSITTRQLDELLLAGRVVEALTP